MTDPTALDTFAQALGTTPYRFVVYTLIGSGVMVWAIVVAVLHLSVNVPPTEGERE